jgi:L-cystine transport system substrate-binding protein
MNKKTKYNAGNLMNAYRSRITVFAVLLLSFALLTGCSSQNGASSANSNANNTDAQVSNQNASADVQTIRVGTGTGYFPYCYLDDDGNLTGYEKAVLDAVDELLPQYEFVYETFDFKNILLSLEADKINIGAHQFEQNPERLANYTFGEVPYTTFIRYITVLAENTDINGIDDLGGKTVLTTPGDNANYFFQAWNEEHPDNPMIIDTVEGITDEERLAGFKSGKWDAYSLPKRDVEWQNEAYGNVYKTVGEPHISSFSYFVFKKGNTQLQQEVDAALKQLKDSGKLSELSIEIIGGDYTTGE